jgi:hypothetical protein
MIKMNQLLELPTVCGALSQSPRLPLRAFPFFPYEKANTKIIREMKRKIALMLSGGQAAGQKILSILSAGLFF